MYLTTTDLVEFGLSHAVQDLLQDIAPQVLEVVGALCARTDDYLVFLYDRQEVVHKLDAASTRRYLSASSSSEALARSFSKLWQGCETFLDVEAFVLV